MKPNKIEHTGRRSVLVILTLVAVAVVAIGLLAGYSKLRELWLEQCVITDFDEQVAISPGTMVKADVIAENLGLREGANLALIDFAEKRETIMKKIPNLRSVTISRHLPDKISIATEERTPLVRMSYRGHKGITGKVADADGMVFICQRGTSMLPTIREMRAPGTTPGNFLSGLSRAALQLVEASQNPDFSELGVIEIDATKPDYLTATLSNYARAKIAWEGMCEPGAAGHGNLVRQLTYLRDAIRSHVGDGATVWNATDPTGRIYADTKGIIK